MHPTMAVARANKELLAHLVLLAQMAKTVAMVMLDPKDLLVNPDKSCHQLEKFLKCA